MTPTRRGFLRRTTAAPLIAAIARALPARGADRGRPPAILLRSGWQTVNIGDIGHTPGVLTLLERHIPAAEVILWPGRLDRGVGPMLRRRFPRLRIVRDAAEIDLTPRDDDPTLADAFDRADLMMHGSGPSVVAAAHLRRWRQATGKPYGIYGVTIGSVSSSTRVEGVSDELRALLDGAAFVYTRETKSLEVIREAGVACPDMQFAPDGTFAIDLRDDEAAARLMAEHDLEPGSFACFVPRLRVTPYWEIHPERKIDPERRREAEAINRETAEADHAKLRAAVIAWVRETGHKALICPEMTYQVGIIRPLVFDPLPDDVKARTAPMGRYWLPDEAGSVYRAARAVVSLECHSPIIALAQGTPAMYVRQPTDTWKGQMYADIGLDGWMFEIDAATGDEIAETLLAIERDPGAARATREAAMAVVAERHRATMAAVRAGLETS